VLGAQVKDLRITERTVLTANVVRRPAPLSTNADIEEGDVLTTSGVDGVYPPGIPVAKVVKIERRADSVFARILCESLARVQGARHVMVLEPVKFSLPGFTELPIQPQPVVKGAK
jgi:rod shape-determining protein MreC